MNLKEYEGKSLLRKYDIKVSQGTTISQDSIRQSGLRIEQFPIFIKAQVLSGKRKAFGGIKLGTDIKDATLKVSEMFDLTIRDEKVEQILLDEPIQFTREYYVSIMIDSRSRRPILIISDQGGSDIEEIKKTNPTSIRTLEINILNGIPTPQIQALTHDFDFTEFQFKSFKKTIKELYQCFIDNDLKLLEINPLVLSNTTNLNNSSKQNENEFIALDCKITIDDNATYRHNFPFEHRTGLRKKTDIEQRANNIDKDDHRGVAGTSFIQFEGGNIGVLASGGGASVIAMDALISYGGKPANYTEYSGNPPAEKVTQLTNIVLDQPNLECLWIVGGTANFTSIYDTLKALIDVLIERKFTKPIVIRRAGPEDEKAFEMVKEKAKKHNLNIDLYGRETPITLSAKYMVDKLNNQIEKNKEEQK
jgi:succinyl-CoA synthetase beta subunit